MSAIRSTPRLLAGTLELYRRYPSLFFVLAASVIVPYDLIVLAATGASPGAQLFLSLADVALITPLISALHVHAVAEVRHDRVPRIRPVAIQGLKVLPVVTAAAVVSWLGILLGFVALIVPGIILMLRWAVVAQAAAIEHEGWLPALGRSGQLTEGHYGHVAAFLILVGVIAAAPSIAGDIAFGHHDASVASLLTGLAVHVITASFAALATALLYYDLLARWERAAKPAITPRPSFDPQAYSDLDRPKGWYIDPASPSWMRHWGGNDQPGWTGRTRTPRKIRQAWRAEDGDVAP
jgi:hypothetical protein